MSLQRFKGSEVQGLRRLIKKRNPEPVIVYKTSTHAAEKSQSEILITTRLFRHGF